jgi:hypothetical protein
MERLYHELLEFAVDDSRILGVILGSSRVKV